MKVKLIFALLISFLMAVSISQIFSIPPYAGDIFTVYRSGYFRELDRGFGVIADSFIGIKSMSKPEYAWIFLKDVGVNNDMRISVYDYRGYAVPAPGEKGSRQDRKVYEVINRLNPVPHSEIHGGRYVSIIPLTARGECRFCHTRWNRREVIGALGFERPYDAVVYYSSERVIIFVIITIVLGALLYAVLRWDPGRNIKELFDK
ncbi:MAG TPA: hypothetical protein PLM53_07160 [Spirochaetota bacterium]|nr:hypothetical protein [Spirochaetota bacterium]HPC40805.1 hypothetical protein [Spirochaetota bacterium]HPL15746.1 hypothetical protein [Spirochaetota bacterium]HQF07805.1 hypothetical protein [Spirochaetota bacterium]HQH96858.1 hypothetical protein [Spirochaetota bacterium]